MRAFARGPFGGGGGDGSRQGGGGSATHIKPDTFYGKKLQTAVREYLEMRYATAHGTDPATPKEIYEAITAGGFQFDAKTPDIALVGLRALLRKRTARLYRAKSKWMVRTSVATSDQPITKPTAGTAA